MSSKQGRTPVSGPWKQTGAVQPKANKVPNGLRPPSHRPGDDNGVAVSLGPLLTQPSGTANLDQLVLRRWVTFPVTPPSIGIDGSPAWSDGIQRAKPGLGERARFVGPSLETVTFEGRLEPPAYYMPSGGRGALLGVENGVVDSQLERNLRAGTLTGEAGSAAPAQLGRTPVGVKMMEGARSGPSAFIEPHAFRTLLSEIRDRGERVRLVIGDQFGWNGIAAVRSFAWRYEDPDPDVLLFSITFRGVEAQRAPYTRSGPKNTMHTTLHDESFHDIAVREFGDAGKWATIAHINAKKLAGLYLYPPGAGDLEVTETLNGQVRTKVRRATMPGRLSLRLRPELPAVAKLGQAGVKRLSPDTRFYAGIKLRMK